MKRLCVLATILLFSAVATACDDNDNGTITSPSPNTTTTTFMVPLSAGNEVPAVSNAESAMSGDATIVLRVTRNSANAITSATADFLVQVNGMLSNTTLIASHIHRAAAGVNGSVVVNTGMSSTTNPTFSANGIAVAPDLAQAILTSPRDFYFNVHTTLNPGGVVRGQLAR